MALTLLLVACGSDGSDQARFFLFGSYVDIEISGGSKPQRQLALQQVHTSWQTLHREWHPWEPGGLTEINQRLALGETVDVAANVAEVLLQAQQLESASGGRFNPTIGLLVAAWGFHTSDFPVTGPPPTAKAIEALLAANPSAADLRLAGNRLASTNPAVQLDLSGIAKGHAADQAIDLLKNFAFDGALVNAGGDLRVLGTRSGQPWRVAIRNPLGGVIGVVELRSGEAAMTSGNYERFRQDESGRRAAHIIDPRTGYPVNEVLAATVIADNGSLADAAATALVVAGLSEWQAVAGGMGLRYVLVTDAHGVSHATPALLQRLEINGTDPVRELPP